MVWKQRLREHNTPCCSGSSLGISPAPVYTGAAWRPWWALVGVCVTRAAVCCVCLRTLWLSKVPRRYNTEKLRWAGAGREGQGAWWRDGRSDRLDGWTKEKAGVVTVWGLMSLRKQRTFDNSQMLGEALCSVDCEIPPWGCLRVQCQDILSPVLTWHLWVVQTTPDDDS